MKRKPTHPGQVLKEDVLAPLDITVTEAAQYLEISRKALSEFINERSALSPNLAVRISKATNTTPESWLRMQMKLDLWEAEHKFNAKIANFSGVQSKKKRLTAAN